MSTGHHWAIQYIGLPWEAGAAGPDAFDCWGFLAHVYRVHYGIVLAPVDQSVADSYRATAAAMRDERKAQANHWDRIEPPQDGDAVLLAHSRHPTHVGVWLAVDGGGVLHCVNGAGVVFSTIAALRAAGWGRVEFYRYRNEPGR